MLYDDQAATFDERAGIPAQAAEAVADVLASITGVDAGGALLDVGAGTGSLSLPLARTAARYVGFDRSPAMLEVFRARLAGAGLHGELHVADGNGRWPADDGSVDVVFCARALHHLDADHVAPETRRVLRAPGGWLSVGRVHRPPDSPKSEMRREMRRLLAAHGYAGRSADAGAEAVFAALERLGGRRVEPRTAARWTVLHRPADSIAAWEGKRGLAGIDVADEVKARVLADLREWAAERFGGLDVALSQEESFELAAMSVPAA
ncbi:MAG TPA: methyltransferase domain-containing protein [Longimicrobium sp.]